MRIASPRLWLTGLLAGLMAACGGGGGDKVDVLATGAITGFGSIYVNGVHYETEGASITRGGQAATQGELRVGQIVTVRGKLDPSTGRAIAESINQRNNLEGPITAVDAVAQTFVVLAHTVRVTAETSFDDDLGGFDALVVGLQVEVNGMPDAEGDIVATRVEERSPGDSGLEIAGKVSDLDTVAQTFQIDDLVIDYSDATLRDFGAGGIANDLFVEVRGSSVDEDGVLLATEVEQEDFRHGDDDGDFHHEIEGLVTRFVSATDFDVAGRPVTTTSSTRYEGGTVADLALNVKVEAEGQLDANGVLVAKKIQFKRGHGAGIAGLVQSTTPDASGNGGTLVVMGVTITVDNATRLEDKSDAEVEMFGVKDLQVGDYVQVRGSEPSALHLTAARLERRDPETDVWVRGTVRDVVEPAFTVLGVAVTTNGSTSWEDITSTQFFATGAGQIVKVKGTLVGGVVVAREVELEHEDDMDDSDDDHGGHGGDD